MSLYDSYADYLSSYKNKKVKEIELDLIKEQLKEHYNKQDERFFSKNGVVMKTVRSRTFTPKKEIYDYLEDRALLPLCVKVDSNVKKHFHLESAIDTTKESLRPYPGKRKVVDVDDVKNRLSYYSTYTLDELLESYNKVYSEVGLIDAKANETKEKLMKVMKDDGVNKLDTSELGTIAMTETVDYDLTLLFDYVSGKKEIALKRTPIGFEVILFPEKKTAKLPADFLLDGKELNTISLSTPLTSSAFIKKSEFNKLEKAGYYFHSFKIDIDPYEFFRSCPISRTKITELINKGILDEKEIDQYFEIEEKESYVTVLTESANDKQMEIFNSKMINRSMNIRRRNGEDLETAMLASNSLSVDLENFEDFTF